MVEINGNTYILYFHTALPLTCYGIYACDLVVKVKLLKKLLGIPFFELQRSRRTEFADESIPEL